MLKVNQPPSRPAAGDEVTQHLARMSEFDRVLRLAVKEAQDENRRLGIPNYYERNGRIVSDQD